MPLLLTEDCISDIFMPYVIRRDILLLGLLIFCFSLISFHDLLSLGFNEMLKLCFVLLWRICLEGTVCSFMLQYISNQNLEIPF